MRTMPKLNGPPNGGATEMDQVDDGNVPATGPGAPSWTSRSSLALRSLALRGVEAAALAVTAYIHIDLAAGPMFADGQVTLAGLFVAQAIAAALVAVWVLIRGSRLAWLAAGGVGLASLAALVVTVYVLVPAIGPLPAVYEPFWYTEKVIAAVAAALAAAAALVTLLRLRLRCRRTPAGATPSNSSAPDMETCRAATQHLDEGHDMKRTTGAVVVLLAWLMSGCGGADTHHRDPAPVNAS